MWTTSNVYDYHGWPPLAGQALVPPPTSHSNPLSRSGSAATGQSSSSTGNAAPTNGIPTANSQAVLDRFAAVYIPQWMRDVNRSAPGYVVSPDTTDQQDLVAYAEAVYPKKLLDEFNRAETVQEKEISDIVAYKQGRFTGRIFKRSGDEAASHEYAVKFLQLQFAEHAARKVDLAAADLYQFTIEPVEIPGLPHIFSLRAPPIREGYPAVDPNDVVVLRQLRPEMNWWQGIEFVATVHATRRAQGVILLRCKELKMYWETGVFNASFRPQDRPFYSAHRAITYIDRQLLPAALPGRSLAQTWLYPVPGDAEEESAIKNGQEDRAEIPYYDVNLNEEQKAAVHAISYGDRRVPFLIQGPPGTGKTKCLVEAVLQIVRLFPNRHLLVCGASNPSADTLAVRLSKRLSPRDMLRFNDESRPYDEVRSTLLPWCSTEGTKFTMPGLRQLLSYKVVVTSVLDAGVLYSARVTNANLAKLEEATVEQLRPQLAVPSTYHFDYLIVDEAAQASEPELAPALSVVLPESEARSSGSQAHRRSPQVVLCGDHMQLGPQISSEEARRGELDLSLLQRLFERPIYRDHPEARRFKKGGASRSLLSDSRQERMHRRDATAPFVHLTKNYRSHVGLLMVPSSLFYDETLEAFAPSAVQNTPLLHWPRLPEGAQIPMLVQHSEGQEEMYEEGASWYNQREVGYVLHIVESLCQQGAVHGNVHPSEISVISPFREQVWRIRLALRAADFYDVNVGRESDMQGAENRVVIVSTVRTSSRFVHDDRKRNRGLIYEPKRFNVSITRAKELLVVVGHVPTLWQDPYWRALLRFAVRRKAYRGPAMEELSLPMDEDDDGISKLEEALANTTVDSGSVDTGILAGSVARYAMLEQ